MHCCSVSNPTRANVLMEAAAGDRKATRLKRLRKSRFQGGTPDVPHAAHNAQCRVAPEAWLTHRFRSYIVATLSVDDVLL